MVLADIWEHLFLFWNEDTPQKFYKHVFKTSCINKRMDFISVVCTNSMAYGTRRFNAAITRALQ